MKKFNESSRFLAALLLKIKTWILLKSKSIRLFFSRRDLSFIQEDARKVALYLVGAGILGMVLRADNTLWIEGVFLTGIAAIIYLLAVLVSKEKD